MPHIVEPSRVDEDEIKLSMRAEQATGVEIVEVLAEAKARRARLRPCSRRGSRPRRPPVPLPGVAASRDDDPLECPPRLCGALSAASRS